MPVPSLKHPTRAGSPAQGSFFLPPCDKRLYSCPTSLATSLPLTLHPTTLPSAFPTAFQLKKEDFCLRDNPPFICEDKNMKRGFSAMCLFRALFLSSLSTHLSAGSIVGLLIQLGPPRLQTVLGVRGLQELGWINALEGGGGVATGTVEWRMNSPDSHLNPVTCEATLHQSHKDTHTLTHTASQTCMHTIMTSHRPVC